MLFLTLIQFALVALFPTSTAAGYLLRARDNTVSTAALDLLTAESGVSSAISTADSFKHWDTCMANHVCKPVAITGIILAFIVCILILSCIVNSMCCAIRCIDNLMCCCHSRRHRDKYGGNYSNNGFAPLPEPQYVQQVDPIYHNAAVYSNNNGALRYGPTAYK